MAHYPSDPYHRNAANRDAEEEALAWVVRFSSGDASDADHHEFERWGENADNALAYRRARRLWDGLREPLLGLPDADLDIARPAGSYREAGEPLPLPLRMGAMPSRARAAWRRPVAAAAAIAVMLGSAHYAYIGRFDYASTPLTVTSVRLADGSLVTMTPGTAMNTVFEGGARHVDLARGEAFFKVHHDAAHPFVVSAGYGMVKVLGTAFSVRRDDNGRVSVVVTEGRVEVKSGAHAAVLRPNQTIAFQGDDFGRVEPVAADLATAWVRGRLVMANQPLAKVVEEINRYGSRRVVLLNEEAGRRRVDAVVELGHIDNWLVALSASQGLFRTKLGPVTILR